MGIKLPPDEEELYRRTDEVLQYIWDPIGISGIPQARDEYQMYLPHVFTLLKQNASAQVIAEYLTNIASDRMGLQVNQSHSLSVASVLVDWKDFLLKPRA